MAADDPKVNGQRYLILYELYDECINRCRSSIIWKCIELYPEALSLQTHDHGNLPLHLLLSNKLSSIEDVLMMIDKYPAALQHRNSNGYLPLHLECFKQCRSSIIAKCIELYPEALGEAEGLGYLPLHWLLWNKTSSIDVALLMIERYPHALSCRNANGHLPLHIECMWQCRSAVIAECIERYPRALSIACEERCLPLHRLLRNSSSSTDDVLMMIKKYPAALKHYDSNGILPIHIECDRKCRSSVLSKCVRLFPETLDDKVITKVINKVGENSCSEHGKSFMVVIAHRPMSLYQPYNNIRDDIRKNPTFRRKVLTELLRCPSKFCFSTHEADYRELNWQPRAAMITLLSQMKTQQRGLSSDMNMNAIVLAQPCVIISNWRQRRCLLLRIIKVSTLTSNLDFIRRGRLCQHDDIGDILLREIIGYL
jgi:hypothetical protein